MTKAQASPKFSIAFAVQRDNNKNNNNNNASSNNHSDDQ